MSNSTTPQRNAIPNRVNDAARDAADRAARSAAEMTHDCAQHYVTEPARDLFSLAKDYAREKPDVAAIWCFGVGVVVGWKIKPW